MSIIAKSINAIPVRAGFMGVVSALLLLALACTPAEAQLVEGILQNVDSANGEITIVTKDGKTVTLTISTGASVNTEGSTASSFEALEPGVSIEASLTGDGGSTTKISARQSKVSGTVLSIDGNDVSIQSNDGSVHVVRVDANTRIKLEEDSRGSLADIPIGVEIEAKFDPETGVAFKLDLEEEEAEIEGLVEKIEDGQLTIRTENGRMLTVLADANTRIELADESAGVLADIVTGLKVEVDFDPSTLAAFEIEIDHDDDEDEDEDEEHEEDEDEDEDEDKKDS